MNYFNRNDHHSQKPNHRTHSNGKGVRCPDLLALATFGDKGKVRTKLLSAYDPGLATMIDKLPNITPGWTNITDGLRVSIDLLKKSPRGLKRHIWLLSDGEANCEVSALMPTVAHAHKEWINITTIGFGDPNEYDEHLLKQIAKGTHAGRFMSAHSAEALGKVLRSTAKPKSQGFAKGRADVFLIDASGSMFFNKMGNRTRMEVVQSALYGLITYKQKMWS